ncbi:tetratricopeptide repeat protein [Flavobacterium sp. CYK-55]|uniref:tetratricopeptide repeat protein n=1 Tax=Flavobacterium sp. CYK-55 TaxID=2835529 RepID=UPI001BCB7EDB|nr:tetratricopeptide repeat protein [Flavobacterium sp. CYK-55]MBS7787400.1 tetratricopeptide repeat protein [Flavobacterium sp. CYK-55]
MLRNILLLFCFFIFVGSFGQTESKRDSLLQKLAAYDRVHPQNTSIKNAIRDTVKVNLLNKIADTYQDDDVQKAIAYYKQSLALCVKIQYLIGQGKIYNSLGRLYNNKGNFQEAIVCLNKAIVIFKKDPTCKDLGVSYGLLGQSYLFLNNFAQSLKYLNAGLSIFEPLHEYRKMSSLTNNLAILHGKINEHEKELKYYQKALKILDDHVPGQHLDLRYTILSNIASIYADQKDYQKSNAMLEECYTYYQKVNDVIGIAYNEQHIGTNCKKQKQYAKALDYFNKALKNFSKSDYKSGIGDSYRNIGEVYYLQHQLDLAEQFTLKGLRISKEIGEIESVKFAYENLAKIYREKKNYLAAYENQVLFKTMSDSMFNTEINNKLTQIQLEYEFKKKQDAIKEASLYEANKQKKIKYVVLISLFLLSLVTISIYINSQKHQKQRKIIQLQKEQIEKSLKEKETLLKEIHHRVKNNLQIISSLLNMQSEEINDPVVLATIQEGQSRVQAMSLIHQNLYQSDEIHKVNVDNYLIELVAYLSDLFGAKSKNIQVVVETVDLKFDFDTAIPLGLMVNELVANAFKYAFAEKEGGTIKVAIKALNKVDYELKVSDNGHGLAKNFDLENLKSLGLKLVSILSKQLRGSLSVKQKPNETSFVVLFKDLKEFKATQT